MLEPGNFKRIIARIAPGDWEAIGRARKLQDRFAPTLKEAGLPEVLGLSVGVAEVPKDARALDAAIQEADTKMYEDKRLRS